MKHKQLSELTIKEFEFYQELLKETKQDLAEILKLFGYDVEDMTISEMRKAESEIAGMKLETKGIKKIYKVGDRRFKAQLSLPNIKAAQFIDFQHYINPFNLQAVLSIFLLPQKKNWYGKWTTKKYNTDYDIFELQDYLYNNFTIGEANELSAFFFNQSNSLLKVMKDYLVKKEIQMRLKLIKTQLKAK